MADVVDLAEVRAEPNPEVVARLEECLKQARSGEMQGFILVADCGAGEVTIAAETTMANQNALIVACLCVQAQMMNQVVSIP